jgi:L-threonylcarbamoyladenylate synthase
MCAMCNETEITTRVVAVDRRRPQLNTIEQAARIIQAGGLVAFPTETVYGLGADALNASAVRRIFTAKGRPAHDPVIAHVAGPAMVSGLVASLTPVAETLIEAFWPGALTLVLPKSTQVPLVVTANGPTVAVRCPDHPIAQALITAAGTPIAAPSANRFSHTSPTSARHVLDDLAGKVEWILDGGPTAIGVESTVLDVSGEWPRLLRPGGVSLEALVEVIGPVDVHKPQLSHDPLPSPGLLDRHYAPQAPLYLYTGSSDAVRRSIEAEALRLLGTGKVVGLLLADEDEAAAAKLACPTAYVGSEQALDQVAHRLFDAMRALDAAGVDRILSRDFAADGIGLAIRDRLRRAAEQVVTCE